MGNFDAATRLIDIGERRLISEILASRYGDVRNWGDDAALVGKARQDSHWVVATTDPCPPPMSAALGFEDWYYTGWLLATINLSDLAAAGARPAALLSSIILPAETLLGDFNRLLDGLDACCHTAGATVIGGNLKEASEVSLSGTAIGFCERPPLSRQGARPGDDLWLIGDIGTFWAGVLGVRAGIVDRKPTEPLLRNVLTPPPKTGVMAELAVGGLVRAAIDTSDGLYPALAQLGQASGVGVTIATDRLVYRSEVREIAEKLDLDPLRLALGWGDWQVIVTCDPKDEPQLTSVVGPDELVRLGSVDEELGVRARDASGARHELYPLDSERFVRDSWFSAGLEGYIDALTKGPLYVL